ncbi:MAG: ArsR/SmtB family transcription factor [Candidatus Binatia bacterium]
MKSALAKDLFPSRAVSAQQVTRWFHALTDETRLQILDRLRGGEQCVCDLTDLLDMAQSRLSFHLKTLKDAGIVTDRKDGRWVYYSLNPDTLDAMTQFLSVLKTQSTQPHLTRCCD